MVHTHARSQHSPRTLSGVADGTSVLGEQGGCELTPVPMELPDGARISPIVCEVGELFDVAGFAHAHVPLSLGEYDLSGVPAGMRVSSLPLKFPGTPYRVPAELTCLLPVLHAATAFEHAINRDVERYYAYLTVQQTMVAAGEVQRGAAIHSDGIQGPRIQPKAPVERGYLIVDSAPPRFYPQAFAVEGVDVDRHLMDTVFESQADPAQAVAFPAHTLLVFDSYCVHQAQPAQTPGPRAFVRLAYSTRQYDRLGNTVNVMFCDDYARERWEFHPRPLPASLTAPPAVPITHGQDASAQL